MFSDGVSTFGRSKPPLLDAPLYVFSAQAASDWGVLQRLAGANGGQCFDLAKTTDAEVVAAIAQPGYRPLPAVVTAGKVSQLLSSTSGAGGRHFFVVGRLETPQAAVTIRYRSARATDVQRTYAIDGAAAASGSLLRRIWAEQKLNELLDEAPLDQKTIAALGKQFGVVTPYTSLLVLETVQQYLMYGIEPPDSSPQLKQEYLRLAHPAGNLKSMPQGARGGDRSAKIDEVVRLWYPAKCWRC